METMIFIIECIVSVASLIEALLFSVHVVDAAFFKKSLFDGVVNSI